MRRRDSKKNKNPGACIRPYNGRYPDNRDSKRSKKSGFTKNFMEEKRWGGWPSRIPFDEWRTRLQERGGNVPNQSCQKWLCKSQCNEEGKCPNEGGTLARPPFSPIEK